MVKSNENVVWIGLSITYVFHKYSGNYISNPLPPYVCIRHPSVRSKLKYTYITERTLSSAQKRWVKYLGLSVYVPAELFARRVRYTCRLHSSTTLHESHPLHATHHVILGRKNFLHFQEKFTEMCPNVFTIKTTTKFLPTFVPIHIHIHNNIIGIYAVSTLNFRKSYLLYVHQQHHGSFLGWALICRWDWYSRPLPVPRIYNKVRQIRVQRYTTAFYITSRVLAMSSKNIPI